MRFNSHPKRMVVVGILLLAIATGVIVFIAAGGVSDLFPMPLMDSIVASVVSATLGLIFIWRGLAALSVGQPSPQFIEIPAMMRDSEQMHAQILRLETHVEHAPIALFRIGAISQTRIAEPLNNGARRLLAPGRVSDKQDFQQRLASLIPGQRNIIEYDAERGRERALASVAAITLEGVPQRVIAVMPVESELEAEAMQAWQKLIHVMTHEIMNSLTPVASLSQSSRDMLQGFFDAPSEEEKHDLYLALDAIHRRAEGLIQFVSGYRSLASVPEARPERVNLTTLFLRLSTLIGPSWQARGGSVIFSVEPETVELMVDPAQLEQALVNLLKNAAEATIDKKIPEVSVNARLTHGARLRIEVRDNGPGIADDVIPHIFTPFFTTKRKGSGIGLSMVRQLVHCNGGTVRYVKSVGSGACFALTF